MLFRQKVVTEVVTENRKKKPTRPARLSGSFVQRVNVPGRYGDGRGGYGLSLLVKRMKNGRWSKTWSQRLRINGTLVTIGLGSFPVVSLIMVRDKALDNARRVAQGEDIRRPERVVPTVDEAFEAYIAASSPSWRGARTEYNFRRSKWHCRSIGSMRVSDVTSSDVLKVITPLWHKNNNTARQIRGDLSSVMRMAVNEGYRVTDPADSSITRPFGRRKKPQHHPSLDYKLVGAAMAAVRDADCWWAAKAALLFLVLTGVRSEDVRTATWDEMDLESETPVWHIPETKNGSAHDVPVPTQGVEILLYAEERTGGGEGLVFPAQRNRQEMGDGRLAEVLRNLKIPAVPHGFRASFRNWAAETKRDHYASEKALIHEIPSAVLAAYMTTDFFELRTPIMQDWADYIEETMGPVIGESW